MHTVHIGVDRLGLTKWFGRPLKNSVPASLRTRSRILESPQKNTLSHGTLSAAARTGRENILRAPFFGFVKH